MLRLLRHPIGLLRKRARLFHPIKRVKAKPIRTRSDAFSRALRELHVFDRVRTGPGKPGKSWNFIMAFSRNTKAWKKATGPGKF